MAEHDLPYDLTVGHEDETVHPSSIAPMLPEFTTAVRGYDRGQVDEYITRLHEWLAEAEERVRGLEAAHSAAAEHIQMLNRQLLSLERQSGTPTPRSVTTYVERMKEIVLEAVEAAQKLRDEAFDEGDSIRQTATDEGQVILGQAKAEAAEILSAVHTEERSIRQQIAELVATRERLVTELGEMQDQLSRLLHRPVNVLPADLARSDDVPEPARPSASDTTDVLPVEALPEGPDGSALSEGEDVKLFDQDI